MKQFVGVAALSVLFFGVSMWISPQTAFGYGYGYGHDTPKVDEKKIDESVQPKKEKVDHKKSGKKHQQYKEYRQKYKVTGKDSYTLLKSYKKSDNAVLQQKFADMQTTYASFRGWSKSEIKKANIDPKTLWKYQQYKKYLGYKKYKALKNELGR